MKSFFCFTFFRYISVGAVNTIFGTSVIFIMKYFFNYGDIISNLVGYTFGFTLSFFLNKRWTFNYIGGNIRVFFLFFFVVIFAYLANLITVIVSIYVLHIDSYMSQLFGVIPYTIVGYIGNKYIVFSNFKNGKQENG